MLHLHDQIYAPPPHFLYKVLIRITEFNVVRMQIYVLSHFFSSTKLFVVAVIQLTRLY